MRVLMIGVGRMGHAIAAGLLESGAFSGTLDLIEPHPSDAVLALVQAHQLALNAATGSYDVVLVAIKPQVFAQDGANIVGPFVGPNTLVLSIMAGVDLATIAARTGAKAVVRAMPNTPGQIGQGITPIVAGAGADAASLAIASQILAALGPVPILDTELALDAASTISGSGPAYVFLLAEVLEHAARDMGLPDAVAAQLARQTLVGSAALLGTSDEPPAQLRQNVTSPGGTTAEALKILMAPHAWPDMMVQATRAALARAQELAKAAQP